MSEREELLGSGITTVIKIGNTVHRTSGKWTESVHALLNHIRTHGFSAAPIVLGYDQEEKEILSYIEGDVYHDPILYSENALISAAKLLRAYHDATLDFVTTYHGLWQFEPRNPVEILCHGDYAPYNCVIKNDEVVGIIDFDVAHPGPRIWDVAYAVYRFAPLISPENQKSFGLDKQVDRVKIFCKAYGFQNLNELIPTIIERLMMLVNFMYARAKAGDKAYQQHIADGHHTLYLNDLNYIKSNMACLQELLIL